MSLYNFLERPAIYNIIGKILSFGNESVRDYLLSTINLSANSTILDVGCGTGRYAEIFAGKFFGIDSNKEYIDYAKKHHQGNFSVMDATDLKFSDNTFNLVFNVGVFHHLSDQQVKKTLNEMKRVTKKDGQILIIDAVFPEKITSLGYWLFKFDRGRYTRTLRQLKNLLTGDGFKLVQDNIKGSFPYRLAVFSWQKY